MELHQLVELRLVFESDSHADGVGAPKQSVCLVICSLKRAAAVLAPAAERPVITPRGIEPINGSATIAADPTRHLVMMSGDSKQRSSDPLAMHERCLLIDSAGAVSMYRELA